jgi:heat shock protein HslJ
MELRLILALRSFSGGSGERLKMKKRRALFALLVVSLFAVNAAQASMITLAGTEWGFSGEIGKAARFIQFRSNGNVNGSTGCNRFTGTFDQDGSTLTIGPLATTRKACLPEAMEREQQFLTMLGKVRQVEGTRLQLILAPAEGNVVTELVRRDLD